MGRLQARQPKGLRSNRRFRSGRVRLGQLLWTQLLWLYQQLKRLLLWLSSSLLLLLKFLRRHLLLVWMMLLAGLTGASVAAMTTLMNPSASVPFQAVHAPAPATALPSPALPVPVLQTPIIQTSIPVAPALKPTARSASPFSLISAILISCAAGCFTLLRCLTPRSSVRNRRRDLVASIIQSSQPAVSKQVEPDASEFGLIEASKVDQAASEADSESKPIELTEPSEDQPLSWIDPNLAETLVQIARVQNNPRPISFSTGSKS